jgi:hypothetical protein
MLPRPGYPLERTDGHLRELIDTVHEATEPVDYAKWVFLAEAHLRECFVDVPLQRLLSERYWRLTTGPVLRHHEMLRAEQQVQRDWLEFVRSTTAAMSERFGSPVSPLAILDTHVIMHAKPLHEIDWCKELDAASVRLVVPLRVVDEVDEKKYARRDDLRDRARKRLRLLMRYLELGHELRQGVRVEVVGWRDFDLGGIPRPLLPPDVDVLDLCEAIRVYAAAGAVSLVTLDTGMRLRAHERDLPVTFLDDDAAQPSNPR